LRKLGPLSWRLLPIAIVGRFAVVALFITPCEPLPRLWVALAWTITGRGRAKSQANGVKNSAAKRRLNEVLTSVCKVATLLTLACASGARSNARRLRDLQPSLLESMR